MWEIDLRFAPGLPPGWCRVPKRKKIHLGYGVVAVPASDAFRLQGYLAHKKTPTPLGPP